MTYNATEIHNTEKTIFLDVCRANFTFICTGNLIWDVGRFSGRQTSHKMREHCSSLLKKFPKLNATQKFITVFTTYWHLSLSPPDKTSPYYSFILPSTPMSSNCLFPSGFTTEINTHFCSPTRILHDLPISCF